MPIRRRTFLASVSALAAAQTAPPPSAPTSESQLFLDAATELEITRLTNPAHSSLLLPRAHRSLTRRSDQLLFASQRDGAWKLYFADLKSGAQRPAAADPVDAPRFASLLPDDRTVVYLSARRLRASSSRIREVSLPEGLEPLEGPLPTPDGLAAFLLARRGPDFQLLLWTFASAQLTPILTSPQPLAALTVAPRSRALLLTRGTNEVCLLPPGASQLTSAARAAGPAGSLQWAPAGTSFFFSETAANRRILIQEKDYPSLQPAFTAPTSQYLDFTSNRDGSVFAGASASQASPLILLMLRVNRRELPICEHRSTQPVNLLFSPNSQRVLFHTNRHGNFCIYWQRVDRLVEETKDESA